MSDGLKRVVPRSILGLLLLGAALAALGCSPSSTTSGVPEEVMRHNILGTAYLGQQKWGDAETEFLQAHALYAADPIPLNNTAVAILQQGRVDEAEQLLKQALELEPDHPYAHYNLGLIEKNRGSFDAAVGHFESVAAHDPEDLLTQYNLGIVLSRVERGDDAETAFRRALERNPTHVSSLYGLGRYLLQKGDQEEGARLISLSQEIRARSGLDEAVGSQYGEQGPYAMGVDYPGGALAAPDPVPVSFAVRNELEVVAGDVARVALPADGRAGLVLAAGDGLLTVSGDGPGATVTMPGAPAALAAGDLDNDGTVEAVALIVDGSGFAPWVVPGGDGSFSAADDRLFSGKTRVEGVPAHADLTLVDRDHDGDLDLFWCWTGGESTPGCRLGTNDGNGTVAVTDAAEQGIAWTGGGSAPVSVGFSDIDNDRDLDLLVAGTDGLRLFTNQRDGTFEDVSERAGLGTAAGEVSAFAIADLDKDGMMDVVSGGPAGTRWQRNRRGILDTPRTLGEDTPTHSVVVFDLDNDGFLDVVSGTPDGSPIVLRNEGAGAWARQDELFETVPSPGSRVLSFLDADGDGDLELVTAGAESGVTIWDNGGGNAHRWITVRSKGVGDNRFGVGAKVEILAGALRQKFEVADSLGLHAGLGTRDQVQSLRYLWPSGVLQDEIQQPAGETSEITQLDRKGTSCPLLYAGHGDGWRFVTDFLGGAAVGYRHAPGVLSTPDTDEYVLIEGGIEPARDGSLRLRLNNQLEEVIWFDSAELVVVDHPDGSEVFPDERLMPGPPWPEFRLFASTDVRPVAGARGVEDGRDLTDTLRLRDRRYVDNFRRLRFKGYAEPHTLEIDLGPFAGDGQVVLLLDGWIDYADSTSNIAAHQAALALEPPRLLVADGEGGFREAEGRMGFPAGLPKTMAVDLTGLFRGNDHRIRIPTNMRIYWDRARVLLGGRDIPLQVQRLAPRSAELRFGGFPQPIRVDGDRPHAYDPQRVERTHSWKAHVGAYTPFGEVGGLLSSIDDRLVTTRNGDEIELVFDAPPPPAAGFRRTYLLFADGFGKDMDPNSAASSAVEPIPFHGMSAYPYPEGEAPPADSTAATGTRARWVGPSDRGWPGAVPQALARPAHGVE